MATSSRRGAGGGPLFLAPPVRAENIEVKMDDLLPRESWASCLTYATSTKFVVYGYGKWKCEAMHFKPIPNETGPMPLRAVCTLFSGLAAELLTDIRIPGRHEKNFPLILLTQVLLVRPRSLKSIFIIADYTEVLVCPNFNSILADFFASLASAKDLERISFLFKALKVPGPLIRSVGEGCSKLKELSLEVYGIDGPFDSPSAFPALEALKLDCSSIYTMPKEQRDELVPPDFSHFKRLTLVENVLWNANWALAVAKAPCLKSFENNSQGGKIFVSNQELKDFCKACKHMPLSTSLTSLSLSDQHGASLLDDSTGITLIETFPMLEHLKIDGSCITLSLAFLKKLRGLQRLTHLAFSRSTNWVGPTRQFLSSSCKLFPTTLTSLVLTDWKWNTMTDEDRTQKRDYLLFVEASFKTHIWALDDVYIRGV